MNPLAGDAPALGYAIAAQSRAGATNSTPDCSRLSARYLVFDGEYIWKYTHRAYRLQRAGQYADYVSRSNGTIRRFPAIAIRASMPNFHGFTAFVVMSSVAARFFTPQVSGIGATPGGSRGLPHRPRRAFQPDHAPAISAVEEAARGSASTGGTTAVWWPARCLARGEIAITARTAPIRWWMFPD